MLLTAGYQEMFCGLSHPLLLAGIRMQVSGPLKISMIWSLMKKSRYSAC